MKQKIKTSQDCSWSPEVVRKRIMSIFSRDLEWFIYCSTEPVKQEGRTWATIGLDFDKGKDLPHVIRKVNAIETASLGRNSLAEIDQKLLLRLCYFPGNDDQQSFPGNHKCPEHCFFSRSVERKEGHCNSCVGFFFFQIVMIMFQLYVEMNKWCLQ